MIPGLNLFNLATNIVTIKTNTIYNCARGPLFISLISTMLSIYLTTTTVI